MARLLAALSVLASLVLAGGPARSGHAPTLVTHDCRDAKKEPARILFACGDGNFYVTRLEWSRWGRLEAKARGVFHFNDCDPSCAEGTFHKRRGTLVLERRLWCRDNRIHVFRRTTYRYDRPWQGDRGSSFRLHCPF